MSGKYSDALEGELSATTLKTLAPETWLSKQSYPITYDFSGTHYMTPYCIDMKEMDAVLRKEVEENRTPSVQYILFNKDHLLHRFQYGLSDISNRTNVAASTTYHAFSVTKTFTALAILQLAEQCKLDLEDPAIQYLPAFPYPADITVRQLLSHAAGIPNPIPLSWIHLLTEHASFDRNKFFKSIYAQNKPVKFKPNEKFAYSNLGFVLLGQLIETVSGLIYEDYINSEIISKLHLPENAFGFEISDIQKHATGYHKRMSFSNLILGSFLNKSKFMESF